MLYVSIARALLLKEKKEYVDRFMENSTYISREQAEKLFWEKHDPSPQYFWLFWYPIKWFSNLILKFLISNK